MQKTLSTQFVGFNQSNSTFDGTQPFQLTEREKRILRNIDIDELTVDMQIQFTSPIKVLNNPVLEISEDGVTYTKYTLQIVGDYFGPSAFANQIIISMTDVTNKMVPAKNYAFNLNEDIALHQKWFSFSCIKPLWFRSYDRQLCNVCGFDVGQPVNSNVIGGKNQVYGVRKMWLLKYRQLNIYSMQLRDPTTVSNGFDEYLIMRGPWSFDNGSVNWISNTYPLKIDTEQACSGISLIFCSENTPFSKEVLNGQEPVEYIDFENEIVRVIMTFSASNDKAQGRDITRQSAAQIAQEARHAAAQAAKEAREEARHHAEIVKQNTIKVVVDEIDKKQTELAKTIDDIDTQLNMNHVTLVEQETTLNEQQNQLIELLGKISKIQEKDIQDKILQQVADLRQQIGEGKLRVAAQDKWLKVKKQEQAQLVANYVDQEYARQDLVNQQPQQLQAMDVEQLEEMDRQIQQPIIGHIMNQGNAARGAAPDFGQNARHIGGQ